MIYKKDKGPYWADENAQIIFNPVSIPSKRRENDIFNQQIKDKYYRVYDYYLDHSIGCSQRDLLGDIQLVQFAHRKFFMNAYVYNKKGKINFMALSKALVELYNLAEEYKINVAVRYNFESVSKNDKEAIKIVIDEVFRDCNSDAYIYTN